jgi:O-antigen ligase
VSCVQVASLVEMKSKFNLVILVTLCFCQLFASIAFGGVLQEYAWPLYAGVALLAVLWAAKLWLVKKPIWVWSPLHIPVLAFTLYAAYQSMRSPLEYESALELLQIGMYVLIYFVAASNMQDSRERAVILIVLSALAFGESFYSLWQFMLKKDVVLWLDRGNQYHGRGSGTYFCPNHLAGLLVAVVYLLVAQIFLRRHDHDNVERLTVKKVTQGYLVLFLLAGLWSTLSRGSWFSLIVAFVFFLVWAECFRLLSSRFVLTIFSALILLGGVAYSIPSIRFRVEQAITFDWERSYEPITPDKVAVTGRETMWQPTFKIIGDHLALGTGPGTWQWVFPRYRDNHQQFHPRFAHSDPLQLTSDYGLIGLALVALAIFLFFWHAARASSASNSPEEHAFIAGSATAIVAVLVHSIGDFNMHIPANAMLTVTLMGMTAAIAPRGRGHTHHEMKPPAQFALGAFALLAGIGIGWFGIRTSLSARAVWKAAEAKQLHHWDEAIGDAQRAIHYAPRSPEAYSQLADIYRLQSLYLDESAPDSEQYRLAKLSIQAYEHSLRFNPFQVEALLRLAVAYELNDDNDRALDAYDQALIADPNNAFVYLRLGIFCHRIGDDERAIQAFKRSLQLTPDPTTATYLKKITGK